MLAVSSLQEKEHHAHMTLEECLALIEKVKPEHAFITHISHSMGKHGDFEAILPDGVAFAYDGLSVEI